MSILVFGAEGTLGKALCRVLAESPLVGPVVAGVRGDGSGTPLPATVTAPHIEALDLETVEAALEIHRPHTVVNAIDIARNHPETDNVRTMMTVNGCFPHHLAALCRKHGSRLLHISTDCVFDGARGNYVEMDEVNARDPYGRSKALGEVTGRDVMTLRTAMLGLDGGNRHGILARLLAGAGTVRGDTRRIFSGPTAPELARIILRIIVSPRPFGGLLHVGAAPIDNCALLTLIRDTFRLDTDIVPDDRVAIDRSLRTHTLATRYRYAAPPWQQMITELAIDWRQSELFAGVPMGTATA